MAADDIITFTRSRDYALERYLDKGKGATGQTALLKDEQLDMQFVCKKYAVDDPLRKREYYERFVDEVRLLMGAFHINVVRVFSCHLYPNAYSGFIIMEYVNGSDIKTYLQGNPERINSLFGQTIRGFMHLEEKLILHRDIRPSNLMVTNEGVVKIIDFGFGKKVDSSEGFGKSITLNWAASEPKEFEDGRYDFCTECYFVGKLFQSLIGDLGIPGFNFSEILRRMAEYDPSDRLKSFREVSIAMLSEVNPAKQFTEANRRTYQVMADFLMSALIKLQTPAVYQTDAEKLLSSLNAVAQSSRLETRVQDVASIIQSFILSPCFYNGRVAVLETKNLDEFIEFLQSQSPENRRIVLSGLWARFNTLPREDPDDIPF